MNAVKFNINGYVRVRLTDYGRKIYWETPGTDHIPLKEVDGWSEWQLWELMGIFGAYTYILGENCFETDIEMVVE